MQVDELTRALHEGERAPYPPPDLHLVRRLGRRRRWNRRAALGGAVLVVAAVGATGVSALTSGAGPRATDVGVASETGADTLSSYERRVLREVPDAFAVGGVVVVPGPLDPTDQGAHRFKDSELPAPIVQLGWHVGLHGERLRIVTWARRWVDVVGARRCGGRDRTAVTRPRVGSSGHPVTGV